MATILADLSTKSRLTFTDETNEELINRLKQEFRMLRANDRRNRYEMGKRLALIQAERAKAKIGTFTTVDLKELKIRVWTAYRLITFYRRVEARLQAHLLQNAKDQTKFPVMTVEEEERNTADLKDDELEQLINEEAAKYNQLGKDSANKATDYRIVLKFSSAEQLAKFKEVWLSLDENERIEKVIAAVVK